MRDFPLVSNLLFYKAFLSSALICSLRFYLNCISVKVTTSWMKGKVAGSPSKCVSFPARTWGHPFCLDKGIISLIYRLHARYWRPFTVVLKNIISKFANSPIFYYETSVFEKFLKISVVCRKRCLPRDLLSHMVWL